MLRPDDIHQHANRRLRQACLRHTALKHSKLPILTCRPEADLAKSVAWLLLILVTNRCVTRAKSGAFSSCWSRSRPAARALSPRISPLRIVRCSAHQRARATLLCIPTFSPGIFDVDRPQSALVSRRIPSRNADFLRINSHFLLRSAAGACAPVKRLCTLFCARCIFCIFSPFFLR